MAIEKNVAIKGKGIAMEKMKRRGGTSSPIPMTLGGAQARIDTGSFGVILTSRLLTLKRNLLSLRETWRSVGHVGLRVLVSVILGSLVVTLTLSESAFATHRQFVEAKNWTGFAFYGTLGTFFADVDGDGKADAIAVNDDGVWVRRSNGCGFGPNEQWSKYLSPGTYYRTRFADVTGDGKSDLLIVHERGVQVRRSNGAAFGVNENWIEGPYDGDRGTFFADVDGDLKADAIAVNDWGVTVRRSNGAHFLRNENWTEGPYYGTRGTFFADVTGDRMADAIVVNDWGVTVRPSDLFDFDPNENWTEGPYYGDIRNYFADVTGDGRADAIVINRDVVGGPAGGIAVRDAIAGRFRSPDPNAGWAVTEGGLAIRPWGYWTWNAIKVYGTRGTFFADVDGNGTADAIAVHLDGVWVRRSLYKGVRSCPG